MIMLCSFIVGSLEHEKSFFLQDGASNVLAIGIYKDSLLVTASNDVVQKDIETGIIQRTFRAHDRTVYSFVVTNDSRMITSGYDDMIVVWDLVTGSVLKRIWLRVSDTRIESLAVKNDIVMAGGLDNKVRQVDLVSGRIIRTIGTSITLCQLDGFCRTRWLCLQHCCR
jgi:WD40 repeat protein